MTEKMLMERYLGRARDLSGKPCSKQQLIERCERDIAYEGREAATAVQLKGVRGQGLKKHRRLIPSGPLGEVRYVVGGILNLDFPSLALLESLGGGSKVVSALATFYTRNAQPPYPSRMTPELAAKFAHEHISIEIDQDVIEALAANNDYQGFPNTYAMICDLLRVERKALEMRWKRVDLEKWRASGLSWPVLAFERKPMLQGAPKPQGVLRRLSERQAKLLQLFDMADEAGRKHMEQAALYAATRGEAARGQAGV